MIINLKLNKNKIKNKLIIKDYYFILISFFALGFNKFIFYLPFFSLYIAIRFFKKVNVISNEKKSILSEIHLSKSYLILTFLMIFSIAPLYIIGYTDLQINSPIKSIVVMFFAVFVGGYFLQNQSQLLQYQLISLYIIGLGLESLAITAYSYLNGSGQYGYGLLYNPFSGHLINSPGVSNTLTLLSSLLIYFVFKSNYLILKFISLLMFFVTLFFAVFLGGRTFFIIVFLSFIFILIFTIKAKYILNIISLLFLVFLFILLIVSNVEGLSHYIDFTIGRMAQGFESVRFQHYAHGLNELFYYPFGGFSVDKNIENTHYFHNVFLDNARLAGWLPIASLLTMVIYILSSILNKRKEYFLFGIVIFFTSFLLIQQDVIIEGNYRILVVMYFSGILLLNTKYYKND